MSSQWAVSHKVLFQVEGWGSQGSKRILIKQNNKKGALLVDQWSTVSLLHSIRFEFITEN